MKSVYKFIQGGEQIIVFIDKILFIKKHGKGCQIHIQEMEEPFYVDKPFTQLAREIGCYDSDED